jgi:hypothetical protein
LIFAKRACSWRTEIAGFLSTTGGVSSLPSSYQSDPSLTCLLGAAYPTPGCAASVCNPKFYPTKIQPKTPQNIFRYYRRIFFAFKAISEARKSGFHHFFHTFTYLTHQGSIGPNSAIQNLTTIWRRKLAYVVIGKLLILVLLVVISLVSREASEKKP